jgi:glycine/D-amino acid oxidase-like deaminating enzyme
MPSTGTHFDVMILGAGIVGCACARECAYAGMRVAIVEPAIPGGATTAAGMGHIVVMDDSPAQLALTQYSRSLWAELQPSLPPTVEYETRGTLWVAADEEEMQEARTKQQTYIRAGIAAEILDPKILAAAEPNLRAGLAGGLRVPEDAVLYPPAAASYLLAEAVGRGAVILRGNAAISIGHGEVKLDNGDVYRVHRIVLATGTDTRLLPWLPVQRRKGHLLITDRYAGFLQHQVVELGYLKSAHTLTEDSVAFNVQPRRNGQLLIGSSRQYGNEYPGVDHGILGRMLERAVEYMPGLANISGIRAWTGFRAATPDKLPLIGPTEDPSVVLAMGFEGLGITNSTGTARLLVDHVMGRSSDIDATPFLPSRLASMEVSHA